MEGKDQNKKILSIVAKVLALALVFFALILLVDTSFSKKKVSQVSSVQKCEVGNTDFDCYYYFYMDLVKTKGIAEAFSFLKEEYKVNPYVSAQCHPITHVIGHAAVSLYPEVYEAFNHGDPYCWSGYYHGVMEEISERIGADKIESELNNICADLPGRENYSFNYYNCVHGLGHGVMAVSNNELFISLDMCNKLEGQWEKESCYGGVFMENVIIDNRGEKTEFLKPEDPLYPCNAVKQEYKGACYLMQTSYALKVTNYDYEKVAALCRQADIGFSQICFQSFGRDASGFSSSNAEITKSKCDLGANFDEQSNCVAGAVKDFISYYHSDKEAKAFCSMLSPDLKQYCLDTASWYYKTF